MFKNHFLILLMFVSFIMATTFRYENFITYFISTSTAKKRRIINIESCDKELVNCFIFTPHPFFALCIINFPLPKWWNVDVMLIKNINFNEFQTDGIFHSGSRGFSQFSFASLFIIITLLFSSLLFQFLSLSLLLASYVFIFINRGGIVARWEDVTREGTMCRHDDGWVECVYFNCILKNSYFMWILL